MESVTALGVFAIVVVTAVNVFLVYSKTQRASARRQTMITAASALLDQIAYEVRTYEIAYWGTLNYDNAGPAETLYEVDIADGAATCEGTMNDTACSQDPLSTVGVLYKTDIFEDERELVLYDNGGDETTPNGTVIAYVFWPSGTDKCQDDSDPTPGFFRFYRGKNDTTLRCQRLFDVPGLTVTNASFVLTQPINPYPDSIDPATEIVSTRDADCGPGGGASFNGSFCGCTEANKTATCFSQKCDVATAGAGNGHCTFGPNRQPAVTVYFTVADANAPGSALTFQTTASQRLYKR